MNEVGKNVSVLGELKEVAQEEDEEPPRPWTSADVLHPTLSAVDAHPSRSHTSFELGNGDEAKIQSWALTEVNDDIDEEEYLKLKYGGDLGGQHSESLKTWLDGDHPQSDEYETDLEEDFPEVKEASMVNSDPTGSLYYSDICARQDSRPVSFLLRNMKKRHVRMRHHYITPDQTKLYAEALQRNTVTETLDLGDNYLGEGGTNHCCDLLKDNMFILNLDLSLNFIGREGLGSVVDMLEYNVTLKTLSLSDNLLTDADAALIAEALKNNTSLTCLNLSHNKFGDLGGVHLAAGLVQNIGLVDLDLSWNAIRQKGAAAIIGALKVNTSLEILDLSWNGLSNVGADALGKVLKVNTSLKVLDISNNRIASAAAQLLSVGLKANKGLESLWMDLNPCGTVGLEAILKSLAVNDTLKLLSIEGITLDAQIYVKLEELQQERGLFIIHSGLGGYQRTVASTSILALFVKYLDENRGSLMDVFRHLDTDGSGDVTVEELKVGLKAHGLRMTNKQVDILMNELDVNKNAVIEYNELLSGDLVARSKEQSHRREASSFKPDLQTAKRMIQPPNPPQRSPAPSK